MQKENLEQEVIVLSKEKWDWMSERNIETLEHSFMRNLSLSTWAAPGAKHRNLTSSKAAGFTTRKQTSTKCR